MERLVRVLDDVDDVIGLLRGGLGGRGTLAVIICIVMVTGAAVVAGWRGLVLALIVSGLLVALPGLHTRNGN